MQLSASTTRAGGAMAQRVKRRSVAVSLPRPQRRAVAANFIRSSNDSGAAARGESPDLFADSSVAYGCACIIESQTVLCSTTSLHALRRAWTKAGGKEAARRGSAPAPFPLKSACPSCCARRDAPCKRMRPPPPTHPAAWTTRETTSLARRAPSALSRPSWRPTGRQRGRRCWWPPRGRRSRPSSRAWQRCVAAAAAAGRGRCCALLLVSTSAQAAVSADSRSSCTCSLVSSPPPTFLEPTTPPLPFKTNVKQVTGLPVVGASGKVVGVISRKDIIKVRQLGGSLQARVKAHMSAPAITVTPGTPVKDAGALMLEHGIRRLPVVDGEGKPLGCAGPRGGAVCAAVRAVGCVFVCSVGWGRRGGDARRFLSTTDPL